MNNLPFRKKNNRTQEDLSFLNIKNFIRGFEKEINEIRSSLKSSSGSNPRRAQRKIIMVEQQLNQFKKKILNEPYDKEFLLKTLRNLKKSKRAINNANIIGKKIRLTYR